MSRPRGIPLLQVGEEVNNRDDIDMSGLLGAWALVVIVARLWESNGPAGRFLRWLAGLRFLRFIGRHSLQTFTFHAVVVFVVMNLKARGLLDEVWMQHAVYVVAVASLLLPAWAHERWRALSAAPKTS